jgi:hypothetical protein
VVSTEEIRALGRAIESRLHTQGGGFYNKNCNIGNVFFCKLEIVFSGSKGFFLFLQKSETLDETFFARRPSSATPSLSRKTKVCKKKYFAEIVSPTL